MGYTHYWNLKEDIPPNSWAAIQADAGKLIGAYTSSKLDDVCCDEQMIFFNGEYETFDLSRVVRDHFNCCKTGRMPYDKLVCAVLSIAHEHHPDLRVSSDANMGSEPDTWPQAVKWASEVLGRSVAAPWVYEPLTPWERMRRFWQIQAARFDR
jgi:hypothetical protein